MAGDDSNPELEQLRRELAELRTFRRLVDALPFSVAIWRAQSEDAADLRFVYGNPEASRQTAIDLEHMTGKPVREVLPIALNAPDAFNGPKAWLRVARTQQPELMPAVSFSRAGAPRDQPREWFNAHALPLGEQLVASIYENVSAHMRAEHEIRQLNRQLERSLSDRERRYRSIFASASVGLCETDVTRLRTWLGGLRHNGVGPAECLRQQPALAEEAAALLPIREINDAALRLCGLSRAELPESLGQLLREASEPAWLALLLAVVDGAPAFETELTWNSSSGARDALLTMNMPRDAADFDHVVVSMLDITERKRLERALWTGQRMEAIGSLTGGVAHDFNNLLMVISSYAGFLRDQFAHNQTALDDVKMIEEAAGRAAVLTHQLLAFSRRQVQQLEAIDLSSAVREISEMLRTAIGKEIRLTIAAAPELELVRADRSQIEQVLMNMAINAREAMPQGGVFTIETANFEVNAADRPLATEHLPPGSYVVLSIADTGTGMSEATRVRIFEPFFSTKAPGRGTGLGLAMVYGIVKQSAGFVDVQSELGHGTTFKIYLPRIQARDGSTRDDG